MLFPKHMKPLGLVPALVLAVLLATSVVAGAQPAAAAGPATTASGLLSALPADAPATRLDFSGGTPRPLAVGAESLGHHSGRCVKWRRVCAYRWGWRTWRWHRCLRNHGC